MKFYKIKHIPTGLFYQPVKGKFSSTKTNLGKRGKVYEKSCSLEHIKHGYHYKGEFSEFKREEWEIVEFVMIPLEQYKEWGTRQKLIESEIEDLYK